MASLKQKAYDLIKERIINSEYKPNEFLNEKQLTEELKLSRTPVREAMITLSQEGFLEIIPKRGIRVVPLSADDVMSIFQVRTLIEPWLARTYGPLISKQELLEERELTLAELKYNYEHNITTPGISINHHPHTLLVQKCENKYIQRMLKHIEDQCRRSPEMSRVSPADRSAMTEEIYQLRIETHVSIIDALLNDDYEEAAQLLVAHVELGKREYTHHYFGSGG